jgi:tetratricopeptide (TPR) repeat protein
LKGIASAAEEAGSDVVAIPWQSETAVIDLYLACLNNLAACLLNKKEFLKAKEVCIRVLELDPRNVKGLLRAARAALALHEHEETEACINRVSDSFFRDCRSSNLRIYPADPANRAWKQSGS